MSNADLQVRSASLGGISAKLRCGLHPRSRDVMLHGRGRVTPTGLSLPRVPNRRTTLGSHPLAMCCPPSGVTLTRLWLLTHHVSFSYMHVRTNQDDILARARGARSACQNALPSMDPAGLLIIPVPRGQKTCIHRRTFISSTKRSASQGSASLPGHSCVACRLAPVSANGQWRRGCI